MVTRMGEMEMDRAASEAAGNWRRFECFGWSRAYELDDADQWSIIYTHHRDSGLLDQSNADAIVAAMEPFAEGDDPDVVFESHSHWAVGWIDGFSLRVFKDGQITEAFKAYHCLAEKLADYPVLDEEGYSRREHEATLDNIADAAWRLKREYDLPDGWEAEVSSWLWEHRPRAVEDRDDRGGYPEEADLRAAFEALGFVRVE
jgi:hypothetical protein